MRNLSITSLSLLAAMCSMAVRADNIAVRVNGERVFFSGTQPRFINGRVMVPLRGVLERLGATVDWNQGTQTVIASKPGTEIDLPIGSHSATVNGRDVELDVP